jgi:phosphohistidine phosphatase SixA
VPRPAFAAVVLTALVAAGCDVGSDEEGASNERPREAESRRDSGPARLADRLRRGGYVLAFRHASTDFSMTDSTRDLRDCSGQRNLTPEGRREARSIGREFRRLGIPVGRVLASPFCRTRETATLAFGRAVPSRALLSAEFFEGERAGERQPARLRQLLASPPRGATNTILVSHNFAIEDATGESLVEGEAVIVTPGRGRRGFEVVSRLEAGEWARLGRTAARPPRVELREYKVFDGAGPHDVAPAASGKVWFTAQAAGELGRLDPRTGRVRRVPLGSGSAPHGVIVGPDRSAWVTDGGLNAIVRVAARSLRVRRFPLPGDRAGANLNTATFDRRGRLWFTGQSGVYGRLDPRSGRMRVFEAPRDRGRTGSPPPGREQSGMRRWPAATSPASIQAAAARASSSRRPMARAHAASGPTPAAGCGSASGTPASWACTTHARGAGASGACPAATRNPMPCMSTKPTWSG